MKNDFEERIKKMPAENLVATFQYVAGLFYSQHEKMMPTEKEIAGDLNLLKHEILNRLLVIKRSSLV